MSKAIQTALQAALKSIPALADSSGLSHVTLANPKVLDMGLACSAIIWPGGVQSGDASACQVTRTWDVPFDIFVRYSDDAATHAALTQLRDDVVDLLDTNPTLGMADVTLAELSTAADPDEVKDSAGGGPYFLMQSFRLKIIERVALTGGEYA